MLLQDQRFRRDLGEEADSWSTCVAMLCDLESEAVPNFVVEAIRSTGYPGDVNAFPIEANTPWENLTDDWLKKLDPPRMLRRLDHEGEYAAHNRTCSFDEVVAENPDVPYAIVVGTSALGNYPHHVIVNFDIVRANDGRSTGYDPHPARQGVSDWRRIYTIEPYEVDEYGDRRIHRADATKQSAGSDAVGSRRAPLTPSEAVATSP